MTRILFVLFTGILLFCKNQGIKEKGGLVPVLEIPMDTLPSPQPFGEEKKDTAQWIRFFVDELKRNSSQKHFVLKAVPINDFKQDILFYQGNVFSEDARQALVFLTSKNNALFFLFDWEKESWQFKQSIPVTQWITYEHEGENALLIQDLNGDQVKDLAVHFYYMSGKHNCNSCYETHLYDPHLKTYVRDSVLENYLDVYFVPSEKKVYYGNHGYGVEFYQAIWEGRQLKPLEKYTFKTVWGNSLNDYWGVVDEENPITRLHYRIRKGKEILLDSAKNAPLPLEWAKIFQLSE